jgi:hypothetical protein
MYIGLHVMYQLFLADFNEIRIFSTGFRKRLNIKIFMKLLPVGAELFHSDGRADRRDEANSRFAQFCEST